MKKVFILLTAIAYTYNIMLYIQNNIGDLNLLEAVKFPLRWKEKTHGPIDIACIQVIIRYRLCNIVYSENNIEWSRSQRGFYAPCIKRSHVDKLPETSSNLVTAKHVFTMCTNDTEILYFNRYSTINWLLNKKITWLI